MVWTTLEIEGHRKTHEYSIKDTSVSSTFDENKVNLYWEEDLIDLRIT